MTKQRVILVPLDGSVLAKGVLPYARALARDFGAALRLLLVRSPSSRPDEHPHRHDQPHASEAVQTLEAIATSLRSRSVCVSAAVACGKPAEQILAAARETDVEMVLMATHGRGGLERALIGSVADEVMRNCARPVLLVVPSDLPRDQEGVELRRLLVPLDGSPLAEAALSPAIKLAEACGASVMLVQALTPVTAALAPVSYVSDLGRFEAEQTAAAQTYLRGICDRFPPSVPVDSIVIRTLSPGDSLVKYAQSGGFDLVVMSTRGDGGLRRLALGSKADLLVRSGVPALLVRPRGTARSRGGATGEERPKPGARSDKRAQEAVTIRAGG